MGGLKPLHAANVADVPRRLARARRRPAVRRFLVEGRDPRLRARARRLVRLDPARRRAARGTPDRHLHVPPVLPRLLRRAVDLVLEHARVTAIMRTAGGVRAHGAWTARAVSMVIPVAVLTVLSTIGGLLEIAGVWHPFGNWIAQVAEPLVEPTTAQDWGTSASRSRSGSPASGSPGRSTAPAVVRPCAPGVQRCSSTSSTSTSSTTRSRSGPRSCSQRVCAPTSKARSSRARWTRSAASAARPASGRPSPERTPAELRDRDRDLRTRLGRRLHRGALPC